MLGVLLVFVVCPHIGVDIVVGGEFNFWMPFVPTDITSTLWAETMPGKGDFYPFHPLEPGEIMRFPGTFCRHFAKPNISGKTRVSLDFRCSVSSCFDPAYLGRAARRRLLTRQSREAARR